MLVGIDQGEVISPLLWCIYYDPLLCKIEQQELGYNIVHQYRPNIYDRHANYNCITVGDLTFMNDTTWITETKESLEAIRVPIGFSIYRTERSVIGFGQ